MRNRKLQLCSSIDDTIQISITVRDLTRQLAREGLRLAPAELSLPRRRRLRCGKIGPSDVAALRELSGLSQSQFARLLGMSRDTLQNWEQGRTTPAGAGAALLRVLALDSTILRRLISSAR